MRCITLTTDFGLHDWFVGTMKGVILGIAPRSTIIDVTHDISPGSIRAGAFALTASYSFFPANTVHVVVVDPGVGSDRRAIAIKTARYTFVGPDNGVLSWAVAREKIIAIHSLENTALFLPQVSATFHGRDVFAPIAARLSSGTSIAKVGQRIMEFQKLPWPQPGRVGNEIRGEVLYVDRFGNAIANISGIDLAAHKNSPNVYSGRTKLASVAPFYQAVPKGRPVAVVGSSGFLEIAINGGSAGKQLHLRVGSRIEVR